MTHHERQLLKYDPTFGVAKRKSYLALDKDDLLDKNRNGILGSCDQKIK